MLKGISKDYKVKLWNCLKKEWGVDRGSFGIEIWILKTYNKTLQNRKKVERILVNKYSLIITYKQWNYEYIFPRYNLKCHWYVQVPK